MIIFGEPYLLIALMRKFFTAALLHRFTTEHSKELLSKLKNLKPFFKSLNFIKCGWISAVCTLKAWSIPQSFLWEKSSNVGAQAAQSSANINFGITLKSIEDAGSDHISCLWHYIWIDHLSLGIRIFSPHHSFDERYFKFHVFYCPRVEHKRICCTSLCFRGRR